MKSSQQGGNLQISISLIFFYTCDQCLVPSETRFCHQVIVSNKEQWQQLVMFERLWNPHGQQLNIERYPIVGIIRVSDLWLLRGAFPKL